MHKCTHAPRSLVMLLACASAACHASRLFARGAAQRSQEQPAEPAFVRPAVISASHNLTGYAPERAADGDASTYWLVPGGERMERMSHDKWLVLDLGRAAAPRALSLLGTASTVGGARVTLQRATSPRGPWRTVAHVRGLRGLRAPTRQPLPADLSPSRYFRLYMRREGHASFRHAIHDVCFECEEDAA